MIMLSQRDKLNGQATTGRWGKWKRKKILFYRQRKNTVGLTIDTFGIYNFRTRWYLLELDNGLINIITIF